MEKIITITEGGVQCDELGCNWKDTTAKDYSLWLNRPCPKCGKGIIITQEELEAVGHMNAMVDLINAFGEAKGIEPGPDDQKIRITVDSTGVRHGLGLQIKTEGE